MRYVIALGLLVAAGSTKAQTVLDGSAEGVPSEILSSAITAISKELSDPRSLQIRMVRYDKYRRVICGEFNSRGPGGGFDPFRQFASTPAVTILVPSPDNLLYRFNKQEFDRVCS